MTTTQIKETVAKKFEGIKTWTKEHKSQLIAGGIIVVTAGACFVLKAIMDSQSDGSNDYSETDWDDDSDLDCSDSDDSYDTGYYSEWGYPKNMDYWDDMDYCDFCSGGDLYED